MAGTPGRVAFDSYVYAARVEGALPWDDQDQSLWEQAAASVERAEPASDEQSPKELHMDAAHAEEG
jgi:hypothetical protein